MVRVKIYKNFNVRKQHQNAIILIGNFDGLHLGHQKLFNEALRYKKKFKLNLVILRKNCKYLYNRIWLRRSRLRVQNYGGDV